MPEVLVKRARLDVITEDRRVLESVDALRHGDLARFGDLLTNAPTKA